MRPLTLIIFSLLIIAIPFVTIAALNALFSLAIPYTFGTWAAALWLGALVTGARVTRLGTKQ